jgi:hypothetical protein
VEDPLPYKATVTCNKCHREVLLESAVGGLLLGLYVRRIERLGCPECQDKEPLCREK